MHSFHQYRTRLINAIYVVANASIELFNLFTFSLLAVFGRVKIMIFSRREQQLAGRLALFLGMSPNHKSLRRHLSFIHSLLENSTTPPRII